jgi:aspartokinase
MVRDGLCLIEVLGFEWRPGMPPGILNKFGGAGIPLSYLSIGYDARRKRNLSLCVNIPDLARAHTLVDEIAAEIAPELLQRHEPVVKLTLYGPHFNERYALVAEIFAAVSTRGIDIHTVGSSVNSISIVVDSADRERTVDCLRRRFSWPE